MGKKRSLTYDEEDDGNIDDDLLALTSSNKKKKVEEEEQEDEEEETYAEEDFDDGYGSDLYGDEEDRRHLESLPDVDREQIIFERWEKRDQLQKKKERLRKAGLLRPRGSSESSKKKTATKQAAANKDRSKMDKKSAIADIGARRKANKENKEKKKSKDEDEDYKDDLTYDKEDDSRRSRAGKRGTPETPGSPVDDEDEYKQDIRMQDIQRILIQRSQLSKWNTEPYFAETVKGCFVRVLLGESERGERTYRLAEIHDLVNGRDYQFEGGRVNTYLMLKHGVSKRKFQMELVSNQNRLSETEFRKWKEEMVSCHEPFPTIEFIEKKEAEIKKTTDYKYSDKDISERAKLLNFNKYSTEKHRLEVLVSETKDGDLRQQYQEALDKLIETWQQQNKAADSQPKHKVNLEAINERAKKMNQQVNLPAKKVAEKKTSGLDPFARRVTQSSFFSFSSDPSPKTPKQSPALTKKEEEKLVPLKSPGTSLVEAHKFDLDIDIDLNDVSKGTNGSSTKNMARPAARPSVEGSSAAVNGGRKTLSLADYQKRRGMNV